MQYHNSLKVPSEKKNEEAIINMVMAITTSKAFEEVAFHEREPLKGKKHQDQQEEEKFMQLMIKIVQELQEKKKRKKEKPQELQHEVTTSPNPYSWSTK